MAQIPKATGLENWALSDLYVNSFLLPEPDDALNAATKRSHENGMPAEIAVSTSQGKFLNLLVRSTRSRRILEIGTLGGYSTIYLARAIPEDGELVEPLHAKVAKENLVYTGLDKKCKVVVGPAYDSLKQMNSDEPFDFAFIDANSPASSTSKKQRD
ncbi:S-adenosyl-L-methionine-dependent methyltransferase [Marasmius fiardii PR-910]|nr:S-adenosyl-L-methionine-dependent methyltransferase [Marasmius fiardii PR-910]